MMVTLRAVLCDEAGTALAEYAIVTTALALAMIATLAAIGAQAGNQLGSTNHNLSSLAANPQ